MEGTWWPMARRIGVWWVPLDWNPICPSLQRTAHADCPISDSVVALAYLLFKPISLMATWLEESNRHAFVQFYFCLLVTKVLRSKSKFKSYLLQQATCVQHLGWTSSDQPKTTEQLSWNQPLVLLPIAMKNTHTQCCECRILTLGQMITNEPKWNLSSRKWFNR